MSDSKTSMPVWALLAAVVIGGFFYVGGKQIETSTTPEPRGTISVSGDGRVFMAPDIAQLSFGVQTGRQPTAKAAMDKLTTSMNAIIAATKAAGVPEKDISTQSFWLNPIYDYTTGGQVFRGFEASQSLSVKVRNLDKVTDVLSAATEAGANQAGGVNFTIDDPEAKRAEAREEAIKEAKEKARVLAGQLGVTLGEIKNFSENSGGWVAPMYMRTEAYGVGGGMDDVAQKAPELPAGEQEINVNVTLTFEIQ